MKRKGFTVVEIIIVCCIIFLLASIAIPNLKRAQNIAKNQSNYHNQLYGYNMSDVQMFLDEQNRYISIGEFEKSDVLKIRYKKWLEKEGVTN
jgi:competence protein ComGC